MWNSIKTEKSFSCYLSFSPFLNLSLWCILYASFLSSFLFSQIISIYPSTFSLSSDRITHSPTWEKVRDFRYQGLNCKNSERGLSHVVISISCYFWWWWWWCFQSWMSWIWISAPKRNSYLTLSTSISRFNQFQFSSIAQSCLTLCNPINHGMPGLPVHYQLPEFTQTLCPLSRWCHPTISSSVIPISSCLQSFPALGSFLMSQLFPLGAQSIGASAWASFLPMNIQGWFPLRLTGFMCHWTQFTNI